MSNKIIKNHQLNTITNSRDYRMDNIKCFLIILVICGHLMELSNRDSVNIIYKIIYSFHMPAFIFVTGYFARFKPVKILRSIVLPYVIFQILYTLFDYYILHGSKNLSIQFARPYWIMWYLMAIFAYYMLLPVINVKSAYIRSLLFLISLIISAISGYSSRIGYNLSLSRILVFLPFFIAGVYMSSYKLSNRIDILKKSKKLPLIFISVAVIIAGCLYIRYVGVSKIALYGSMCFAKSGINPLIRTWLNVIASSWIVVMLTAVPRKKIPLVSYIGKNTLWIYLLHGFIVRLLSYYLL